MKTNLIRALAALALVAPLGLTQAQDIQLASHAELNDIYNRLAELESRLAATNVSGCGCADAVSQGCGDCCDDCCGCAGYVAGAELLWLKAFSSDAAFTDFNYNEGFRFWVGYQGAGGLGARIRYFDYSQAAAVTGDIVDIQAIDAEIYDMIHLGCNWDLLVGGGIRYIDAQFSEGGAADDAIFGTGPVVTAELYRHISDRAALYVIGRESIVAGSGINDGALADDMTMTVSEIQLGGQLHRDWNGGLLFARAGWEAQAYTNLLDGEETVTLMGGVISIGLMR